MRLGGRIEKKKRLFSNPKPAKTARCVALGALDWVWQPNLIQWLFNGS